MNRQAQAAVLFLTGGAILHAALTDLYLRYVKAGLQPLLVAAGVVLIATAVATVWYERQAARMSGGDGDGGGGQVVRVSAGDDIATEAAAHTDAPAQVGAPAAPHGQTDTDTDTDTDADADTHAHHEPRISWLLVLPLLALILVAPPALGSYSAMRTGTVLQKQPWGFADLPAGDTIRLNLVDYAGRAAYDNGRSLDHRHIKIAGLLALDRDGTPYLVRMALSCCAADAQPVKIGLAGRIPPVLRPDSWLEVTGTYTAKQTKDPVNEGIIPFLDVTEVKPVKAPRDPYDESWNG
ncbi:TIGR03943 family putative permease subunit [Streptomyces phaeochromogenes]|uniref:TIGR03943 family putative permease subunit n=1 Tax=Streptomyces phaeochromogenes TaxID=1923 RepID=UPI0033C9E600